jgi:sporulation protein YlmC with PRC-barrel domain
MRLTWSQVSGLPLYCFEKERPIGRINAAFFNPETGALIALLIGYAKVVVPPDIEKWTRDGIWIGNEDELCDLADILRIREFGFKRCYLLGKKVLAEKGNAVGRVKDFTIDTQSGTILNIESAKGFFFLTWNRRIFPYTDISEITDREIILKVDLNGKSKVSSRLIATT